MLRIIKWVVTATALSALRTHSLPGRSVHTTFANHAGSGLEIYWVDVERGNNLIAMLDKPIEDGETNSVSLPSIIAMKLKQTVNLISFLSFSILRSSTVTAVTSLC